MPAAAASAVRYAQEQFGMEPDYSEGGIERVEQILGALYDSIPRGVLSKFAAKFGFSLDRFRTGSSVTGTPRDRLGPRSQSSPGTLRRSGKRCVPSPFSRRPRRRLLARRKQQRHARPLARL